MGLFDSKKEAVVNQQVKDELLNMGLGDQGKGQIASYELIKKWLSALRKHIIKNVPSLDARRLIVGIDTLEARINDEINKINLKKAEIKHMNPTAMGVLDSKELFHIKALKSGLADIAKNAKERENALGGRFDSEGKKVREYIEAECKVVGHFIDHCDDLIMKDDCATLHRYEEGAASMAAVIEKELPALIKAQHNIFAPKQEKQKTNTAKK